MNRLMLSIVLFFMFFYVNAQKHTFTNNTSTYKNFLTGVEMSSDTTNNITIEDLGNGFYRLSDVDGTKKFKFSHYDEGAYVYFSIGLGARLQSGVKMSELARGVPGNIAIDSELSSSVVIYRLNNKSK